MADVYNFIVKDSAMIISNSEYVLEKHCLLHDDFKAEFEPGKIVGLNCLHWRLKRIFYNDSNDDVIYITSVFFEYTDNKGEIEVEYIKEA